MKVKNYFIILLVAFLCLPTNFTIAQSATSSATTTEATTTKNAVQRRFGPEPALQKIAQGRLLNLAANMSNRLEATISRLQNLSSRLNSRLNKMSEAGLDVTLARTQLAEADAELANAAKRFERIDIEVNAFIGSVAPKESWLNLKNTFVGTATLVISAHKNITQAIASAKNATALPTEPTATTTAVSN